MEPKAHHLMVGIFSVFVIALSMLVFLWLGGLTKFGGGKYLDIVFSEAVTGLSPGSPVLFSGINVGKVLSVAIDPENHKGVVVSTIVDGATPLTEGTMAKLGYQGLTGLAYVQILAGDSSIPIVLKAEDKVHRIEARLGGGNGDLIYMATHIARRISDLLTQLTDVTGEEGAVDDLVFILKSARDFLHENQDRLTRIVKNLDEILGPEGIVNDTKILVKQVSASVARFDDLQDHGELLVNESYVAIQELRQILDSVKGYSDMLGSEFPVVFGDGLVELRSFAIEGRAVLNDVHRMLRQFDRDPSRFLLGKSQIPEYEP